MQDDDNPAGTQILFRHLDSIAAAEVPAKVIEAIQGYLNTWPKDRVRNLQKVDGGWAPFDESQSPSQINDDRDLKHIRDAIHRQCLTLREARLPLTAELMELDEVLSIATLLVEAMKAPEFKARHPAAVGSSKLPNLV